MEFRPMNLPPLVGRWTLTGMFAVLLSLGGIALRAYLHSPGRGLPYHDSFAKGTAGVEGLGRHLGTRRRADAQRLR